MQTAKALPAGNWPKPSDALALERFYLSFHKNDCNKFVTAGKKLKTKTFESITDCFEAQFNQNKNDGTLKRMELKRIKKCTHLKLKNKLRIKICARKDKRSTYQAKRKLASCNAQPRSYNDCNEQCHYIKQDCNCNCTYNEKR
jgi:hypothetical protein